MKILRHITSLLIIIALMFPLDGFSNDDRRIGNPDKKSKFSKKGNFKKDESFNAKNRRAFGPPDPGGGGGGNPVPVDPAYGLLAVAGLAFTFFLVRRKQKNDLSQ